MKPIIAVLIIVGGVFLEIASGVDPVAYSHPTVPAPVCARTVFPIVAIQRLLLLDGDTISVTLDLGMDVQRTTRVRLRDVDTWELHGPDAKKGRLAEQASHEWLAKNAPYLEFEDLGDDKYGGRRDGIIRNAKSRESLGIALSLGGHGKQ